MSWLADWAGEKGRAFDRKDQANGKGDLSFHGAFHVYNKVGDALDIFTKLTINEPKTYEG